MLELADIVRRHGAAYCAQRASRLLPSQARALRAIAACRTPSLGGQVWQCDSCGQRRYSYHSCGNRNCPKCHGGQTATWLDAVQRRLLPCGYFLVTFTLPSELRAVARAHQKAVYGALMRSAAQALLTLARDPQHLGARPGCLTVLHTWTRALLYHPHVHILVTAGGLADDGAWIAPRYPNYLLPVRALALVFRAKLCAQLRKAGVLGQVPRAVWKKNQPWVVHCQPAGSGTKVLEYLGRYVFRIALCNSRLEHCDEHTVQFRYRDRKTGQMRHPRLAVMDFLDRFLQHVLPRGLTKVRYAGLFSRTSQPDRERVRALLPVHTPPDPAADPATPPGTGQAAPHLHQPPPCPHCTSGHLVLVGTLIPHPPARAPP